MKPQVKLMDKKLKKGIVAVFVANIINVIFSLATNFFLPKYLSIESYAGIKTFQLYISYVGLLHLGYVDGMYLKYGGKELRRNLSENFYTNLSTLRCFQFVLTVLVTAVSILTRDWIVIFFALSILPQNVANYFKFLYQAVGDFTLYGKVMNISTILTFAVNMLLLFVFRTDNCWYYLIIYNVIYYLIWIYLEIHFHKNHSIKKGNFFSFQELWLNIKDGFLLTLGNLSSIILTSIDRWFVKFLMTTVDFAQYSFAVSIENFLNLAITPVTTTLYNYFCREDDKSVHKNVYRYVMIFAVTVPAAAFPVKFILEHFLRNYIDSVNTVFMLFSAQIFYIIIKSVYVNLYKVQRRQHIYFVKLIIIILLAILFNAVFFKIIGVKEAFAFGTLLSSIVWFILSTFDFKYLHINIKDVTFIFAELTALLLTGCFLPSAIGFICYIIFTLLMMLLFMRNTLMQLIAKGKSMLRRTNSSDFSTKK